MKKTETKQKGSNRYLLYLVIFLGVALMFAAYWISSSGSRLEAGNSSGGIESTGDKQSLGDLAAVIEDGIYAANRTYPYHAGNETILITVGISDSIVDNISVVGVGDVHPVSQGLIDGVNEALPSLIVGKRIDEINLPKQISGSSLTTAAVESYLNSLV